MGNFLQAFTHLSLINAAVAGALSAGGHEAHYRRTEAGQAVIDASID
ncbi:MAG TPA: hypothetical protein VGD71_03885 [Kribbella sp.]